MSIWTFRASETRGEIVYKPVVVCRCWHQFARAESQRKFDPTRVRQALDPSKFRNSLWK